MHVKTLILGGGITGLSAAYHLEQKGQTDYLVLEKENEPGGLCRSIYKDGFTFDYSGHLLHLHTPQGKKIVRTLLGKNLRRKRRRAWIYTGTSRVPFPFQANLFALPADIRQACVDGLLTTRTHTSDTPKNFAEWCLKKFGKGIYEHFLKPYNTKVWGCPPASLSCEWCAPFVPTPTVREIRQSAGKKLGKKFGYNTYFYYPQIDGCGALVNALAQRITHLKLRCPVTQINLLNKTVRAGGKVISFDNLINTLPLPVFLKLIKDFPSLNGLAQKLSYQSVTVYQGAFQGKHPVFSWIYCPDPQDPFYRVGMQSAFSPENAPQRCYSLYAELPGLVSPSPKTERKIEHALLQKGIIAPNDKKLFSFFIKIPYAYVRYDKDRTDTTRYIIKKLAAYRCFCAGRYGLWEYSFIEKSLLQGQEVVQKLV